MICSRRHHSDKQIMGDYTTLRIQNCDESRGENTFIPVKNTFESEFFDFS